MTIWERIKAGLATLNKPMAQNKYLAPTGGSLPDEYLVYFLITNNGEQYADNAELSRMHHVQISYFNRAGLAGMPDIAAAMEAQGFRRGPEVELAYNELTRHFGLALEFYYLEEE